MTQTEPLDSTNSSETTSDGLGARKIPVHSMLDNRLLRWADESEAYELIKRGRATLNRNRKGKVRRLYLLIEPKDQESFILNGAVSINTEASRTIRRESVGDIYHAFGHITKDLKMKKQVSNEELAKDGVFGKGGVD